MFTLVPNIDLGFQEAGADPADRVRAVAAAGFDHVAMFRTSDKDVLALRRALDDAGVAVASSVAEPYCDFTFPGTDSTRFLDGLRRSLDDAVVLGAPRLVVTTGIGFRAGAVRHRSRPRRESGTPTCGSAPCGSRRHRAERGVCRTGARLPLQAAEHHARARRKFCVPVDAL